MLVEGDVRIAPAGAGLVRFQDRALIVDRDDAVHWVLRCVTPAVLRASTGSSAYGLEIRHAADALLDTPGITATTHPKREVDTATRWLREARPVFSAMRKRSRVVWSRGGALSDFSPSMGRYRGCSRRVSRPS